MTWTTPGISGLASRGRARPAGAPGATGCRDGGGAGGSSSAGALAAAAMGGSDGSVAVGSGLSVGVGSGVASMATSTITPRTNASAWRILPAKAVSLANRLANSGATVALAVGSSSAPAKTLPVERSVTATRSGSSPAIDEATRTRMPWARTASSSVPEVVRMPTLAVLSGSCWNPERSSTS